MKNKTIKRIIRIKRCPSGGQQITPTERVMLTKGIKQNKFGPNVKDKDWFE